MHCVAWPSKQYRGLGQSDRHLAQITTNLGVISYKYFYHCIPNGAQSSFNGLSSFGLKIKKINMVSTKKWIAAVQQDHSAYLKLLRSEAASIWKLSVRTYYRSFHLKLVSLDNGALLWSKWSVRLLFYFISVEKWDILTVRFFLSL